MAITFATSGYSMWAGVPDKITISGIKPGTRLTYDWVAGTTQSTPVTEYEERLYFYASATGEVTIERSPLRQRGASNLYAPLVPDTLTTLESTYKVTRFRFLDYCTCIDAATDEEVDVVLTDRYFAWGSVPLPLVSASDTRYRLYTTLAGGHFLTKATRIEVNKYLPHNLIYFPHAFNTGSAFTYAKGATSYALTLTDKGSVNTRYLANAYGDGVWSFGRTNQLLPGAEMYTVEVDNCADVLTKLSDERLVYLRWLNSLGGLSYGLFEVRARGLSVAPRVRSRDYSRLWIASNIFESDVETLAVDSITSMGIGRGMVGWDRYEDYEDLLTSIEVMRYDTLTSSFLPVQISGGSSGDRSKQYNDFACTLTMPQNFNQKR